MNDINSMLDGLDEEVEYAEAVTMKPGDKVGGEVVGIDSRDGGYGEYPILTLEVEGGTENGGTKIKVPSTRSVHVMAGVAKEEIGWDKKTGRWDPDKRVRMGDRVALKYVEDRHAKSGNDYQYWRVAIERRSVLADVDNDELFT